MTRAERTLILDAKVADYLAGMSAKAIAKKYQCAHSGVHALLVRRGIPRRRIGGPFKGGRSMRDGYVLVNVAYSDEMAKQMVNGLANGRYVLEHRLVMARALGRPLRPDEEVHHINGDRADNRLENLQLRKGKHGSGQVHRCLDCGSTNIDTIIL